jgi:chromosome segregation protein
LRLTHIKLAGFKSFVDPTHIPVPGNLVGVVGPNGCGKSNVIDAVRWVLGESSAKHLRGETMQDVIFNGSGERKPANRSSVELVFDNSLGKAAGPWSNYAEISVKRVLERNGESAYFINNQHVRRRDVADIFLGTGLGGRAYAIIEQGMISRIVEARPEELRTFLEEAAGVSKYRERRKETEQRLEDTRENLARVDDILQELHKQLTHLEEQAEVAAKYRALEASLKTTQQLLWLLRKQEAAGQRARHQRELDQLVVDLEAQTARLRELESRVETQRTEHYAAADAVHAAQAHMYEANAEVARVEQALQHLRDSARRVDGQIAAQAAEESETLTALDAARAALAEQERVLEQAQERLRAYRDEEAAHAGELPQAEAAFAASRAALDRLNESLARQRQDQQVELTRREHASKLLAQLDQRRQRLGAERDDLHDADHESIERLRRDLSELDFRQRERRDEFAAAEDGLHALEQTLRAATEAADAAARELGAVEARQTALELLQRQVSRSGEMHAWLDNHQLDGFGRLWQGLRIAPGWEDALEAVLRERLNGIALADLQQAAGWLDQPPPGKVSFFQKREGAPGVTAESGRTPLAQYVTCTDPGVAAVLGDWLDRVFVVDDAARGFEQQGSLPAGVILVCPQGHLFTRHSVSFHATDSEIHGILSRQREIEELARRRESMTGGFEQARRQVSEAQLELDAQRAAVQRLRASLEELQQQRHDLQLDQVRLTQQAERVEHRRTQIAREMAEIEAETQRERQIESAAAGREAELAAAIAGLVQELAAAQQAHARTAEILEQRRQQAQASARSLQEAQFQHRTVDERIRDLQASIQQSEDKAARVQRTLAALRAERAGLDEAPLQAELTGVLNRRLERESALNQARQALEAAEHALKSTDQERMSSEQQLGPMRERSGELKLKEQEARIAEENYAGQLAQAQADEGQLAAQLDKGMRPGGLQNEINRLTQEIAALGAVNLAALEELEVNRERKTYLEAQSRDLHEAVSTLENAIRRIDRETRERLQATFDQVNDNLSRMFPTLFGGGEARLVMTGEEVLDAGISMVARPPGKRNTSIHLLSGGEKALTALSLVFSLFQLNPAPFCLLDEVDAPLDDSNTERFCSLVRRMAEQTQFLFISHNKITMEMAQQLIGVTMPEQGVSKVVAVDVEEALRIREEAVA